MVVIIMGLGIQIGFRNDYGDRGWEGWKNGEDGG